MPVTAKLSQKFYERFGDDLTNELVDWMNQVDAGYRTEFRELFELNFERFNARLQHGLDGLRNEIQASRAEAMKWNILMWIGAVGTMVALVKL